MGPVLVGEDEGLEELAEQSLRLFDELGVFLEHFIKVRASNLSECESVFEGSHVAFLLLIHPDFVVYLASELLRRKGMLSLKHLLVFGIDW